MDEKLIKIRDYVLHHDQVVVRPISDDMFEISWPKGKKVCKGTVPDDLIIKIFTDLVPATVPE